MFQSLPHSPPPMMDRRNQGRRPPMLRALQLLKVGPPYYHHLCLPCFELPPPNSAPCTTAAAAHCVLPAPLHTLLPILLAEMRLLSAVLGSGGWVLLLCLAPQSAPWASLSCVLPWKFRAWRSWFLQHSGAHTRLSRVPGLYPVSATLHDPLRSFHLTFLSGIQAQKAHLAGGGRGRSDVSPLT